MTQSDMRKVLNILKREDGTPESVGYCLKLAQYARDIGGGETDITAKKNAIVARRSDKKFAEMHPRRGEKLLRVKYLNEEGDFEGISVDNVEGLDDARKRIKEGFGRSG